MFFPDFVVFAARFVLVFSFLETTLFVFSTLFGVYILLGVLLISMNLNCFLGAICITQTAAM